MKRSMTLTAIVLAVGLLALGCSSDDDDAASTTTGPDDTTSTSAEADAASETVVVSTGDTAFGEVLTDAEGLTLYIFADDGTGDPTCVDGCADIWPPVLAENIETHGQLDIEVNLVDGDDTERQVTVNGRPVYTYSDDIGAGEANGQGFGGKWWVLDVDGNPIESTDPVATTTTPAE